MELELTKEQSWISESVDTLLSREWVAPADIISASAERQRRTWTALVEFGALSIGDEGELGAVELCLIARALGSHLASVPFLGSAAVRLALAPQARSLPAGMGALVSGQDAIGIAVLEAGSGWTVERAGTRLARGSDGLEIRGRRSRSSSLRPPASWRSSPPSTASPRSRSRRPTRPGSPGGRSDASTRRY